MTPSYQQSSPFQPKHLYSFINSQFIKFKVYPDGGAVTAVSVTARFIVNFVLCRVLGYTKFDIYEQLRQLFAQLQHTKYMNYIKICDNYAA